MTLPSSSSANFQVVLDLIVKDEVAMKSAIATSDKLSAETEQLTEEKVKLRKETEKLTPEIDQQVKAEKAAAEATKKSAAEIRTQVKEIRAQAREIGARNRLLLDQAADIDRIAKPLQQFGLIAVTGIFAAANKYVNSAKVATETTIAWKKAQDSLNESGMRIGAVLAEEALPILKEAAEITAKIASFIEKHPEIVGVTLKAGLLALTLGTLGKAVSGGIRLYADMKMDAALTLQMTAAELQLKAAQMQIAASKTQSLIPGSGTGAATTAAKGAGGFLATTAGATLASVLAVLGGLIVGVKGYDAFIGGKNGYAPAKDFAPAFAYQGASKFGNATQDITGMSDKEVERKAIVFAAVVGRLTKAIDENHPLWTNATNAVKRGAEEARVALEQERSNSIEATKIRNQERIDRLLAIRTSAGEELTLFRNAQLSKLRDFQNAFTQERIMRRAQFVTGLNDLSKSLFAELKLKRDYFANLFKQLGEMFQNAIKSIFRLPGSNTSSTPTGASASSGTASSSWSFANLFGTRDTGGYTPKGIYRMAWDGNTEFTLSGPTTKMLEKIVGGQLNQQNVIQATQRSGSGQVVWNDSRRFDGQYTSAMKREVQHDTQAVLREVFGT